VSQATAVEIRSQFAVISTSLGSGSGSDSDFDSDSGSISSGIAFDDVAEDLKTYIENLNDLSSSLEYPATDIILIEESSIVVTEDISSMPEPIRPYFRIIRDRFPSTEAALVRKLGEANWQRRERLKLQLASRPMTDSFDSNSDDDSSVANTVRDTNSQPKDTHRPSIDLSITHESVTHESITTVSELSEPSLFDNNSAMFSRRQYSSDAESITSFATSIADGSEHGQRKIPKLAENHDFEAVFQCQICGEMLRSIRNRADWKLVRLDPYLSYFRLTYGYSKHVYGDLQPYICLFTECNLGLQTFQSRRDWIDHEFQIHRVNSQWCCNLCREDFGMQEVFRAHIEDIHQNEFVPSQIEEFVGASKRFVSRDGRDEKCPFCLTISSQTRKSFAGHVGRHLQEISLAALPLLEDSPDDKSDSESYGDDDGNNGDDDDGNNSDDGNDSDDDDGNNSDDGRDKEDDVPVVPVGEGKTINQLDSHKDSSSTDINDTEEIPSCVGNIEGDSVPPNTKSEPGLPTSKIEKGLAEHISALKILWTTLQQWTKHQATATQVSDAYVKVEFGFNIMCQNLTAAEIDVSDFDNAPELLRQVLEEALGQGASAENVNVCLSLFREIYIPLLNGLKRKCEIAKQKNLSQRKEVYEEARQGLRQTPETSVFEDAEWRALYRQIEREQTSLLNEIYAEESTSISPDEATGSQLGSGKIVQANRRL
jgi:hypothetical protein